MRFYGLLLLCVLALPVPAQPTGAQEGFKASMQKFIEADEVSGCVSFIGTRDGIIDVQVLGLADVENKIPMKRSTLFRIASMTKPITVLALLMLVEAGLIDVEDPVEKYLPEFK